MSLLCNHALEVPDPRSGRVGLFPGSKKRSKEADAVRQLWATSQVCNCKENKGNGEDLQLVDLNALYETRKVSPCVYLRLN